MLSQQLHSRLLAAEGCQAQTPLVTEQKLVTVEVSQTLVE
jgi:hypothetical protein